MALAALEAPVAEHPPIPAGHTPWAAERTCDPGMQRLAIGVLERTLDDLGGLMRGPRPERHTEDASAYSEDADESLAFLADATALEAYCDLAGTSVVAIQRVARDRLRLLLCRSLARWLARRRAMS